MTYFLQLDGIDGDAIERDHENWFTITGMSWSVTQSTGGGGAGAGTGKATLQPVVLSTLISPATPQLLVHCATGRHIATAVFEAVREGELRTVAWRYHFEDVLITGLHLTGAAGDPALEQSLTLTYGRIRLTTFRQTADGSRGAEVTAGWDVAAATPL